MSTAANVARLCEIKDVTEEDAALIRAVWKSFTWQQLRRVVPKDKAHLIGDRFTDSRRAVIDAILGTCGVELLGIRTRSPVNVYYCNGGDTYATTILFLGDQLVVGCVGDYAESVRQPEQP